VIPLKFILLCLAGWIHREQQAVIEYLQEEIQVLKEIHGKRLRFNDRQRRRLAAKAKKIRFGPLKEIAGIATPHTLRSWFRKLVAQKYDSSAKRTVGRPRTKDQIVSLVVQFATENELWGYTKIRDALDNIGHEISRDTVANILMDHGIEPAPERGPRTTWADFLKRHWDVLAATDFFTIEIFTLKGIVRYHVLFVIHLATREVHIAGIAQKGKGPWMEQIARNLTDGFDGFLKGYRFLIHDRDPLFTAEFKKILADSGVDHVQLPKRSPNLNAFAERFVKSIKHECLNQMIFFSEGMLRHVIAEYMDHYHEERNHQGIDSKIIKPAFDHSATGEVSKRERLGGLLNFYCREAA
jgi:putative transposase